MGIMYGGSFAVMYVKPENDLGFDPELGRAEHFLFTSLGGVFISGILWLLGFGLLPAGRNFLAYRRSPRSIPNSDELLWVLEDPPRGFEAFFRAAVLAFLSHFYSVCFIAFLGYALVMLVVLF